MVIPDRSESDAAAGTAGGFDPEPWRGELLAFLRRAGAGADAEDLVQETFLRSLRRPPSTSARAWLYRVALNALRDRRRSARTEGTALLRLARPETAARDPGAATETRNLAAAAWRIIERLPEQQRLALYLRIQRHMDYDEVGTVLECDAACARQHFHLGVKAVRDRIGGGDV